MRRFAGLLLAATSAWASEMAMAADTTESGGARPAAQLPAPTAGTLDAEGRLHLGPRAVPLPKLASPEAQQALREAYALRPPGSILPPPGASREAWRQAIAKVDAAFEAIAEQALRRAAATVEAAKIAGVTVYVGRAHTIPESRRRRAIMHLHGGGFVFLAGGKYAESLAATKAAQCGCTVYSVNYRTPPDHPFPAALDDAVAVYRELLKRHEPADLAIAGESAGGNLAAAVTLKIRDAGLPMPGMVVLLTPGVDLTNSGDSSVTNLGLDARLTDDSAEVRTLYAGGHDLRDPYLSPVFGDFGKGFPPTFIQAGLRDLLLSGAVVLHRALRRAGIDAELHVWEGQPHGPFSMGASTVPEDLDLDAEIHRFLARHWEGDGRRR